MDGWMDEVRETYPGSACSAIFCLRWCSVAAAVVGSCSSSLRFFSREAVEGRGGAAGVLVAETLLAAGAVEVEGVGSKPEWGDNRESNKADRPRSLLIVFLLWYERTHELRNKWPLICWNVTCYYHWQKCFLCFIHRSGDKSLLAYLTQVISSDSMESHFWKFPKNELRKRKTALKTGTLFQFKTRASMVFFSYSCSLEDRCQCRESITPEQMVSIFIYWFFRKAVVCAFAKLWKWLQTVLSVRDCTHNR